MDQGIYVCEVRGNHYCSKNKKQWMWSLLDHLRRKLIVLLTLFLIFPWQLTIIWKTWTCPEVNADLGFTDSEQQENKSCSSKFFSRQYFSTTSNQWGGVDVMDGGSKWKVKIWVWVTEEWENDYFSSLLPLYSIFHNPQQISGRQEEWGMMVVTAGLGLRH